MKLSTTVPITSAELLEVCGDSKLRSCSIDLPADIETIRRAIKSPLWPHAADPFSIVQNEQDRIKRAISLIAGYVGHSTLKHGKFLDFGCGLGHCVQRASDFTQALGYDPVATESEQLTNDWERVVKFGPYHTILMYDVIDHIPLAKDQLAALGQLKEVLAPEGKIYMRCHPYCAAHGAHLYEVFNKAYAQFFFTKEELEAMGYTVPELAKVTRPLAYYGGLLNRKGFKYTHQVIKRHLDSVFVDPEVSDYMIRTHWAGDDFVKDRSALSNVLSMQFVDYILTV